MLAARCAVDTSVIIEMMLRQPLEEPLKKFLQVMDKPYISTATRIELGLVAFNKMGQEGIEIADGLLASYRITSVDFTAEHMQAGIEGYRKFGRRSGHLAQLNLGDAFTYGFARAENLPLLFVGDDFVHTDLDIALPTALPLDD